MKKILYTLIVSVIVFISCEPGTDSSLYQAPKTVDGYFAYKENQKYSNVLIDCIIVARGSCSLNTLPFIGLEKAIPSKDDIMNRLIVSHAWIGKRFSEFLNHYPKEAFPLFNTVTAIVVGSNVRPSQYLPQGSVILLDPKDLWLTKTEFDSISKEKDYRTNLGDVLSFDFLRRPIKNNKLAYTDSSLTYTKERTIQDILFRFSYILFHELAHAIDYFHHSTISQYKRNIPFSSLPVRDRQSKILNNTNKNFSISSRTLKILAAKKYIFRTQEHDTTTAKEAANEFSMDIATDLYSYVNNVEDFSMLFTVVASKKFFNVEYDIAFTNNPGSSKNCKDYIIAQGWRNRLANPAVKTRALTVAKNVMPSIDWDGFFSTQIGKETALTQGKNWCLNTQ